MLRLSLGVCGLCRLLAPPVAAPGRGSGPLVGRVLGGVLPLGSRPFDPDLGANANVADCDNVLAPAKLFSPYTNWTWYITELDPETGQCFGLVEGFERELGYFDLSELAETTVFGGVPAVERDLYWEPKTLGEIKNGSHKDSPPNQETDIGETMTDESGTEIHPSDVVGAEEFLFGHATDDTLAGVGGELPTGDAADDAPVDVDEEQDADGETAEEPDVADGGGVQPAQGETETTEELKVVVSIRGDRATIGVQQPSADPHIESFDDLDLAGLALEVPAVIERARARWEEEPRYPAYEKPASPARRQRRREPAADTATAEGEVDQQQPETLRLF